MQHYTRCPIQASGGSIPSDKWGERVWSSRSGDEGGGGGGQSPKKLFSVCSKNKRGKGGRPFLDLPLEVGQYDI